jgi:hypothetical protein
MKPALEISVEAFAAASTATTRSACLDLASLPNWPDLKNSGRCPLLLEKINAAGRAGHASGRKIVVNGCARRRGGIATNVPGLELHRNVINARLLAAR